MAARIGGGSRKGIPNVDVKAKRAAAWETLEAMGYDPAAISLGVLAMAAANNMPCGVCRGTKKTKFQPGNGGKPTLRPCQSCWESGMERIDPKDRAKAGEALSKHLFSQLKAVDHTSSDGSSQRGEMRVVMFGIEPKGLKPRMDIPPQINAPKED